MDMLKKLGLLNAKGERFSPYDFNYLSQTGDKSNWGDLPLKHDQDGFEEVI